MDIKYGCINEDEFSLRGPRMIEGDECDTLEEAFAQALELMQDYKIEKISITRCKYYGEDGNGFWGEIPGDGQISVDGYSCEWLYTEEKEDV